MRRAIVTFGVGPHRELLDVALPSFERYAEAHGYELVVAEFDPPSVSRPASWIKVPILKSALGHFDEVLWLDADVVIVDHSDDIAGSVPGERWQALAQHNSASDGLHPNCGVWLLRKPMIPALDELWAMTRYVEHPWWEQAAMHELLGYDPWQRPLGQPDPDAPTDLFDRTELLSSEWNFTPGCANARRGRFMHAAGPPVDVRAQLMRGWAADALAAA
jgi:hypothetical protein